MKGIVTVSLANWASFPPCIQFCDLDPVSSLCILDTFTEHLLYVTVVTHHVYHNPFPILSELTSYVGICAYIHIHMCIYVCVYLHVHISLCSLLIIYLNWFIRFCLCKQVFPWLVCLCVDHMNSCVHGSQKRVPDFLVLKLEILWAAMCMLGTELKFFARALRTLNHWAKSPAPNPVY